MKQCPRLVQQYLAIQLSSLYLYPSITTSMSVYTCGLVVKNLPDNDGALRSVPGLGRSPGEGNGNPLQHSRQENSMDRGDWWSQSPRSCKELDMTEQLTHKESEKKVKVIQYCLTLQPHGLYSPWNSPGQNTGVGCPALLQGIFPTQ